MPNGDDKKSGAPAEPCRIVPSLAVSVNHTALAEFYSPPQHIDPGDVNALREVLSEIWKLLKLGVGMAWASPESRCLCECCHWSHSQTPEEFERRQTDEEWARLVAEILTYVPYAGPAGHYTAMAVPDERIFYKKLVSGDPAYPLCVACQQLSTIVAITRGFEGLAEEPFDASSAAPAKTRCGGKLFLDGRVQAALEDELTPGSTYVVSSIRHIGPVLRINRDRNRIQVFDTSALRTPLPENPAPKALSTFRTFDGGNFDYGWADKIVMPFRHWGFLPQPPVQDLKKSIAKMSKARPLGFARLVLRELNTQDLVFASPLLRMYTSDGLNFSIALCMSALRYLIGRLSLEGLFLIYIPRYSASQKTDLFRQTLGILEDTKNFEAPSFSNVRDRTIRQMVEAIGQAKGGKPWNPIYLRDYICITVVSTACDVSANKYGGWTSASSQQDGLVVVKKRFIYKAGSDKIPNRSYWQPGSDPERDDFSMKDEKLEALARLPWDKPSCAKGKAGDWRQFNWTGLEYFRGDWDGGDWNEVPGAGHSS